MRSLVLILAMICAAPASGDQWDLGLGVDLNITSLDPQSVPSNFLLSRFEAGWYRGDWGGSVGYRYFSESSSVGNYSIHSQFHDVGLWGHYRLAPLFRGSIWTGLGAVRRAGSIVTELAGSKDQSSTRPQYIPGLEVKFKLPLGQNWMLVAHSLYLLAEKNPERLWTLGLSVHRLWPAFTE